MAKSGARRKRGGPVAYSVWADERLPDLSLELEKVPDLEATPFLEFLAQRMGVHRHNALFEDSQPSITQERNALMAIGAHCRELAALLAFPNGPLFRGRDVLERLADRGGVSLNLGQLVRDLRTLELLSKIGAAEARKVTTKKRRPKATLRDRLLSDIVAYCVSVNLSQAQGRVFARGVLRRLGVTVADDERAIRRSQKRVTN